MSAPRESAKITPYLSRAQDDARSAIEAAWPEIVALAGEIFHDPEPPGAEVRTVDRLTDALVTHGFTVEDKPAGLPTAFHATYRHLDSEQMRKGLRHPHLGIIATYDADPRLGHTYGRQLRAAVAVGTAVALAAAARVINGSISVVGCPADADGDPMLEIAEHGFFEQFDAVLAARPAPVGLGAFFTTDSSGHTLAGRDGTLRFSAHEPAAVAQLTSAVDEYLASLGSDAALLLEEAAGSTLRVSIRAPFAQQVHEISTWLLARADDVATAHGLTVHAELRRTVPEMLVSRVIIRRARTYAGSIRLRLDDPRKSPAGPPTAWGAVSQQTPTADAWFPIGDVPVDWGTEQFAVLSNTPAAYEQARLTATAVALAGVDLLADMSFRAIADNQLIIALGKRGIQRSHRRWTGIHPVFPKNSPNGETTAAAAPD
ncbi:MAG: hypothetical protein DCC58_19225 [Chloroflexi bacterium]|nr:MAG: hypothetical protein DCC58_19225 [Chloroflexota bacterium]